MVTVGAFRSIATLYRLAAKLPSPSESTAAPAATFTVTVPLADGVIVAV